MRLAVIAGLASVAGVACAADPPPRSPRVVNVTTDSQPGWLPSLEQEGMAQKAVTEFLAAMDAGRAADAYALLDDMNKKDRSFAEFSKNLQTFNGLAGSVIQRRIVKFTWTKDSSRAPAPGIFVAFDLVSRFARIDRHCGYLVLYQAPSGGAFRVTRQEDNYMDDDSAKAIEAKQSRAALDHLWTQVSARCPNYPSEELLRVSSKAPLPETTGSTVGYATVAAALADLRSRPGVTVEEQNGWTIATEETSMTMWSFAPSDYPAYPAVVKRQFVKDGKGTSLQMNVLCHASKAACDDLVRTFMQMNAAMQQSLRR